MKRLAWLLVPLALSGCLPELQPEYLCASVGEQCPPDWTCWADGRCRDHEPGQELGELCTSDLTCTGRVCATSLDPTAGEMGLRHCSFPCDEDDDCPTFPAPADGRTFLGTVCQAGACRIKCNGRRDCPQLDDMDPMGPEMGCHVAIPDPSLGLRLPMDAICMDLMRNDLDGSRTCEGNEPEDTDRCFLPGWCVMRGQAVGLCSMICETRNDTDQCPRDSECAPMVGGFGACMRECTDDATACDTITGTTCIEHGDGRSFCMPTEWMDLDPLPDDGMLPDLVEGYPGPGGGGPMP